MITHITTVQEYEASIAQGTVLVDFYADWCGPCQLLAPVIEDVDAKHLAEGVTFVKVNVDNLPEIVQRYGIQSIPTLIIFKEGKISGTSLGYLNKNQLLKFLEK